MKSIPIDHSLFDAYIFDCDGTLADTMPIHFLAWTATLDELLGTSPFTEQQFYRFGGMPAWRIIEVLNEQFGCKLPPEETAHKKESRFLEMLQDVKPIEPVLDVLKSLGLEAKTAVASGGLTSIVLRTLDLLKISVGPHGMVKHVIGYDQVTHGKPSPELFLLAASKLQADPKRCLVFEDADPGFQAAQAAGMTFIDVRDFRTGLTSAAVY